MGRVPGVKLVLSLLCPLATEVTGERVRNIPFGGVPFRLSHERRL